MDERHDQIENDYYEKSKDYRIEVTICEDLIDTDSYSEVLKEEHIMTEAAFKEQFDKIQNDLITENRSLNTEIIEL